MDKIHNTIQRMLDRYALLLFGEKWDVCAEIPKVLTVTLVNFTLPKGMRIEYTPRALHSTEPQPTEESQTQKG